MLKLTQLNLGALFILSNLLLAASRVSPPPAPLGDSSPETPLVPEDIETGIPLRILPLGDSITWGYGSTSGNGYREALLTRLRNPVTYIGSEHSGNMSNNENEGHPGAVIAQIGGFAERSLVRRPNVILLMAGTNDMVGQRDVEHAPQRLGVLIDRCVAACPDAVLLVAQLTPFLHVPSQERANVFNAAIPGLVRERVDRGKKVVVVNMEEYVEMGWLVDGLHPSDLGYDGMARAWYDGIQKVAERGWIEKPVTVMEVGQDVEEL